MQKQSAIRRNMLTIVGICLSVYFCYHLIAGQRGYFRLLFLENQIASTEKSYETVQLSREEIEKKVVMLRPGTVDRDLLEERARYVLGYKHKDELILLQNRS